jgi:hypothetical protein
MKPIEDRGHLIEATRPWKPKTYRSDRRPDPVQCAGCLIVVCDPDDAASLHLEQSDGSRWRRLQFADEGTNMVAQPLPNIDIEAIAREVLARAVAQFPKPSVQAIAPSGDGGSESNRVFAQAMLEMSDHVAILSAEHADLMARVDYIERHALAAARIKEPA